MVRGGGGERGYPVNGKGRGGMVGGRGKEGGGISGLCVRVPKWRGGG